MNEIDRLTNQMCDMRVEFKLQLNDAINSREAVNLEYLKSKTTITSLTKDLDNVVSVNKDLTDELSDIVVSKKYWYDAYCKKCNELHKAYNDITFLRNSTPVDKYKLESLQEDNTKFRKNMDIQSNTIDMLIKSNNVIRNELADTTIKNEILKCDLDTSNNSNHYLRKQYDNLLTQISKKDAELVLDYYDISKLEETIEALKECACSFKYPCIFRGDSK